MFYKPKKKEYQKLFFRFEGHLAPLLSVVLDPKAEYAASASCDGSVKIWKIESQSCLKTWKDCWAKSNDLCRSPTPGQIGKLAFLECIFFEKLVKSYFDFMALEYWLTHLSQPIRSLENKE